MKPIFLLFFVLSPLFCKAQPDNMLFYYSWQLNQINIEGQTDIPYNAELNYNVILNFYDTTPYTFSLKVCQTLSGEIEYPANNVMIFPSVLTVSGDACTLSENSDFEALLFNFFQSQINTEFTYYIGIVDFDPPNYFPIMIAPNGDYVEFHETYLGVESFDKKLFSIYPNPVSDIINVRALTTQNISKIRVLSLEGRLLLETNEHFVLTQHLSKGMYLVEAIAEDGSKQIEKIIKK